jgi:glycosyltransferase involved in cell wall biosynthesis
VVVHHFGPDPATVGGMASVIRVMTEHNVGGEIVQAHPTWAPRSRLTTARLFAAATRSLLKLPTTRVAHVHLSERGSFLREGSLVALANRRGLVTVVTIHGASFLPFAQRYPWLVSATLRRASLVTCLEQETLNLVGVLAPDVQCEILPNPVFVEAHSSPAAATDELVVFAGEVGLRKGADVLHRAWQLVAQRRPVARCLMVGPVGDFTPPDSERLELRGPVTAAEMRQILKAARVVVLPARAEAMPMILTEAMSAARPFIGTPVGAIPELANAGGLLVPVDDELALADRLTELLADPALAQGLGEAGQRFCIQTRSVEVIDARLRGLYFAAAARD